jgi:hypothetical protein
VRLAAVAVLAVAFSLAAGWADARLETRTTLLYIPLMEPNPWLQLAGIWLRGHAPAGAGGALLLLGILWLRGLALLAPLLPIALAVRGSRRQLTLVFTILLFVLAEFAPLMVDQPYPSLQWLAARTGLGLLRALVLGLAMAVAFGLVRSRGGARPAEDGNP